jgi:predicted SprT family Zn-dependent metalloprotease
MPLTDRRTSMGLTEYRCTCGATLRYKQDLRRERGTVYPAWKCRECGTPVPGQVGEKLSHQHPS